MERQNANYDIFKHNSGMEDIGADILLRVLSECEKYRPDLYTQADALNALARERLSFHDFGALISPVAEPIVERIAERAKTETARYHGNGVALFTPLYIANHCVNHCTYCGFNINNNISRAKLSFDEIAAELQAIAATGLDEVLILTGESRKMSDVAYIGEAVKLASGHFKVVGIEIYPLNTDEYAYLRECGAEFANIYQETYTPEIYMKVHPAGPKRCFAYRFNAHERALRGGMRGVSFGSLLGLGDFHRDVYAAGLHAYLLQQKYPHAEISFSAPRIRAYMNHPEGGAHGVSEKKLLLAMLAYRIFMPYAGLTISTRERPGFRDRVAGLCATKISAGVCVGVGGHGADQKGGEQFEIADARSVGEIHDMLRRSGLQPIYTNHIRC